MKAWYLTSAFPYNGARGLIRESHFICVQSSVEMQSGARASGGQHFGGVHFCGPSEKIAFEKLPGIRSLGHVHAPNNVLPAEAMTALAPYGVTEGDSLHVALTKVIAKCGVHGLALDEL